MNSDQLYNHRRYSSVNASLIKDFKKPQLSLYVRGNDIFKGQYGGDRAMFLPYIDKTYNDSRTLVFGLTYRFGKQSVKVK